VVIISARARALSRLCVVVRLYDSSKTPRYIRVAKKVAIDTRTLSSQGAQAAFADGPLWVSVLEQAFTALTKDGAWRPGDPKYSRIEGMSYLPLQTILGPDAKNLTIPDLADPATRSAQFSRNANSAFGGPAKFFFEQMMDPVKITDRSIQELIKKTVFPGQDALAHKFFTWADPAAVPLIPVNLPPPPTSPKIPGAVAGGQSIHLPPPPPPPVMGSTNVATFKREITDQPAKMIRYEDIEKFFHNQQLDGTTAAVILKWLETNQVVSGKKFTKLYSTWDDWVFRELQTAYNGNYPVYLSSRSNIGTPEASGASANEPKVRGLVGDHAFALVSAKLDQSRKMVTIRNPWATYGRTYGPDPTDQRPRAAEYDSPVSTLPVQEITKRFRRMVIAGISLA